VIQLQIALVSSAKPEIGFAGGGAGVDALGDCIG
jgi:hypothetical protein